MNAKINNRLTVYEGKVYSLIRENVTLENGITTDMDFIEHPGATAIIPLVNESRIVLLKQYRHALRKHIWEIPAGTLDPRESALNCAKRELIEEPVSQPTNGIAWERLRRYPGIQMNAFMSFWPRSCNRLKGIWTKTKLLRCMKSNVKKRFI